MSTAQPNAEAIYEAFIDFVSSTNWSRSFDILEAQRDLLLPLGARLLLIQFLAEPDDKEVRQRFALHLTLLEIAAADGITAARSLVDEAMRQGNEGGAGNHAEMQTSILTSSGHLSPSGPPAPPPTRPVVPQGGGGSRSTGNSALDDILSKLPPDEREQVLRNLDGARQGQTH